MKIASFRFRTGNLGDFTQVIAAASYLPHIDALVDRDQVANAELDEPHLLIMNSWFQNAPRFLGIPFRRKPPSAMIDPIFHGFCVGRDRLLNSDWLSYLADRQPIGCRDKTTVARLKEHSIDGYWSGCMSELFGRQYVPVPPADRSGIVFVDVPEDIEAEFVPASLRQKAVRLTNMAPPEVADDPLVQMHLAAAIIDIVRRAELVVTSRLHISLPCVAFRTPVVVLGPDRESRTRRFSGFDEFLPTLYYGKKTVSSGVDWDSREPAVLLDELVDRHTRLLDTIEERVGAADHTPMPTVAAKTNVAIADHDFGDEGGEIGIGIGRHTISRPVSVWSKNRIEAEIDGVAVLPRFRLPLRVRPRGRREWIEVGPLGQFLHDRRAAIS